VATIVTRAGKGAALTHQEVDANFTGLNTELGQKELASNKGVANGYASLDAAGKVPSTQLPSYVDDVVEVANFASLPGTGETGKIYVTIDANKTYRWTGSTYIEISASPGSTDSLAEGSTNLYFTQARARASISASGSLSYNSSTGVMSFSDAVTSVAGRTGAVTLTSSDVGLGNVENKSSSTIRGEITSGNVTTALGYTPYNATNPSGYITSSALSSYLPLSGGTVTGQVTFNNAETHWTGANTYFRSNNQFNFLTVSGNAQAGRFAGIQVGTTYSGTVPNDGILFGTDTQLVRSAANQLTLGGDVVLDAGNYSSYALPLSGGTLSGKLTISASAGLDLFRLTFDADGTDSWYRAGSGNRHRFTTTGGTDFIIGNSSGVATLNGNQLLTAGNYTSYSPSLTGSGASGTWGISVTGNAGSVTNGLYSLNYNFTTAGSGWYRVATTGSDGRGTYNVEVYCTGGNHNPSVMHIYAMGDWGYDKIVNVKWDGDFPANAVRITRSASNTFLEVNFTTQILGASIRVNRTGFDSPIVGYSGSLPAGGDTVKDTLTVNAKFNSSSMSVSGNAVLHAGNYSGYALPSTGGTLSGSITVNGAGYSTISKPSPSGYQTTLLVGTTGGGLFFTSDNAIIGKGAYFNNGWIATAASGSSIDLTTSDPKIFYHSGATVGSGVSMSSSLNILHAGNYNSYALPLSGGTLGGSISFAQGANINFGTSTNEAGPWTISVIGSGGATPATKGTGRGRNLIIKAGDSDNGAGLAGGDMFVRGGSPTSPSVVYGDVRIADLGGQVYLRAGEIALGTGNYNSYALPLSGGTMTGDLRINSDWGGSFSEQFIIYGTYPSMTFRSTTSDTGWLVHTQSDGGLTYYSIAGASTNNWTQRMTLLTNGELRRGGASGDLYIHSGNYSSYALPLSGGTLTGQLNIGTGTNLSFGSQTRQMINLWGTGYGIGVQSSTTYFRSDSRFSWHRGGSHSDSENNAGGGTVAMTLDGSSNLVVTSNVTAYSDERVKANWRTLDDGFVVNLANVKSGIYDRTDIEITQVGVSAQSLREVLPHAVIESDDGDLSVAYGNAAMVSAIELAKELVTLRNKVAELEARIH